MTNGHESTYCGISYFVWYKKSGTGTWSTGNFISDFNTESSPIITISSNNNDYFANYTLKVEAKVDPD